MSGRYVNKSIRKDIYSNSGAVALTNFVENTNSLESIVDFPVRGSILVVPDITDSNCFNYPYDYDGVLGSVASGDAIKKVVYKVGGSAPSGAQSSYVLYSSTGNAGTFVLYIPDGNRANGSYLITSVSGSVVNPIATPGYYRDITNGDSPGGGTGLVRTAVLAAQDLFLNDFDGKYYWVDSGLNLNLCTDGNIYIDNDGFNSVGSGGSNFSNLTYPLSGTAQSLSGNSQTIKIGPDDSTANVNLGGSAAATGGLTLTNGLKLPNNSKYLDGTFILIGQTWQNFSLSPFKLLTDKTSSKKLGGGLAKLDQNEYWVGL